MSDDQTNSTHV